MPSLTINSDNWWTVVEAARKHAGKNTIPAYVCLLHYYNVCIVSIITGLSIKLWQLYQQIRGTKNETYASYFNLPAFWVDACNVIETEIARIDTIRAEKAKREQVELVKKIGQRHGR